RLERLEFAGQRIEQAQGGGHRARLTHAPGQVKRSRFRSPASPSARIAERIALFRLPRRFRVGLGYDSLQRSIPKGTRMHLPPNKMAFAVAVLGGSLALGG